MTVRPPKRLAQLHSVAQLHSNASATATCEQSRPKQGVGKDQASNTYK